MTLSSTCMQYAAYIIFYYIILYAMPESLIVFEVSSMLEVLILGRLIESRTHRRNVLFIFYFGI